MATRNPWERRNRERDDARMGWENMGGSTGLLAGEYVPRALQIEDLDAMAYSAVRRGHQQERDRMGGRHREELRDAQREAWDLGYGDGLVDGRDRQARDARQAVEALGLDARTKLVGLTLSHAREELRQVTKADLVDALAQAASVVNSLLGVLDA